MFSLPPPTYQDLIDTSTAYGVPSKLYQDPFYSNPFDKPSKTAEIAGHHIPIRTRGLGSLLEWQDEENQDRHSLWNNEKVAAHHTRVTVAMSNLPANGWEYAGTPPGRSEISRWLKQYPTSGNKAIIRDSGTVTPSKTIPNRSQVNPHTLHSWQYLTEFVNAIIDHRTHPKHAFCEVEGFGFANFQTIR
jgi:DNA polymerase zeta